MRSILTGWLILILGVEYTLVSAQNRKESFSLHLKDSLNIHIEGSKHRLPQVHISNDTLLVFTKDSMEVVIENTGEQRIIPSIFHNRTKLSWYDLKGVKLK